MDFRNLQSILSTDIDRGIMKHLQLLISTSVAIIFAFPAITSGRTDENYAKHKDVMGDRIKTASKSAVDDIVSGMTIKEVEEVLGKPKAMDCYTAIKNNCYRNYGRIWIAFKKGISVGYVKLEDWKGSVRISTYEEKYKTFHKFRK